MSKPKRDRKQDDPAPKRGKKPPLGSEKNPHRPNRGINRGRISQQPDL